MRKFRLHSVLVAALGLLCATHSRGEAFTLLIYESKEDIVARTDPQKAPAYWAAYGDYAKMLTDAGILRGGTALPGNASTTTLTLSRGKVQEAEKPLAASSLELGGYFIIEVPDQAAALEWARKAPGLATGAIEVKRHFPNPGMPTK